MAYPNTDFEDQAIKLNSPCGAAVAVTPDDDVEFDPSSRYVWVGGLGNLAVTMLDGSVVTFTAVPAGTSLPIRVRKVMATNTTATNIVMMY